MADKVRATIVSELNEACFSVSVDLTPDLSHPPVDSKLPCNGASYSCPINTLQPTGYTLPSRIQIAVYASGFTPLTAL